MWKRHDRDKLWLNDAEWYFWHMLPMAVSRRFIMSCYMLIWDVSLKSCMCSSAAKFIRIVLQILFLVLRYIIVWTLRHRGLTHNKSSQLNVKVNSFRTTSSCSYKSVGDCTLRMAITIENIKLDHIQWLVQCAFAECMLLCWAFVSESRLKAWCLSVSALMHSGCKKLFVDWSPCLLCNIIQAQRAEPHCFLAYLCLCHPAYGTCHVWWVFWLHLSC